MSGYYGYSKSNNAVEAENDHKYPQSRLRRLYGLQVDVVNIIDACEWHHTSKYFNCVDYYDARDIIRSRVLKKTSISRPTAVHLYNRLLMRIELIDELLHWRNRFINLRERLAVRLSKLGELADAEIAKKEAVKQQKAAKKEAEREKIRQKQLAVARKKAQEDYKFCLQRRCQNMKITKEQIQVALTAPVPIDGCCLVAQIQKWFANFDGSLNQKTQLGV